MSSNTNSNHLGTAEAEYKKYLHRRKTNGNESSTSASDSGAVDMDTILTEYEQMNDDLDIENENEVTTSSLDYSSLYTTDTHESSIVAHTSDSNLMGSSLEEIDTVFSEYDKMKVDRRDRKKNNMEAPAAPPHIRKHDETSRPPLKPRARSSPDRSPPSRAPETGPVTYDDYESDSVVEIRSPRHKSGVEQSIQTSRDNGTEREHNLDRKHRSNRKTGRSKLPNSDRIDRSTPSDRRDPAWGPDAPPSDGDGRAPSLAGGGPSPGPRRGAVGDTSDSLENSIWSESDEESGHSSLQLHEEGIEGPFRGFHSSISDLFKDETIACGALACCGLLVSTRTEYIIKRSWGPSRVVSVCLLLSVAFYSLTYLVFPAPVGKRYDDEYGNDDDDSKVNGELARFWTVVIFFGVLGTFGRRYRVKMRANILHRSRDGTLPYNSPKSAEHGWEGACAHSLIGCYPADGNGLEYDEVHMREQFENEDCCMRFYRWFSSLFCGKLLHCWVQVFGICAVAQEAREVKKVAPKEMWMIDYITFQPFNDYNQSIIKLRNQRNGSVFSHFRALSKLSVYIIIFFVLVIALVSSVLYINLDEFTIANGTILVLTFVQSFVVVFIVHWVHHRFDLSLDSVVKMFAAGFTLAFPIAYYIEMVLQIAMSLCDTIGYYLGILIGGEHFENFFLNNSFAYNISSDLVQSFVIAALTEELVKFYIFRAVEHPDFNQEVLLANGNPVNTPANTAVPASLLGLARGRINDTRTVRGRSAAITIAMICVALGFACAENLCYVFSSGMQGSAAEQFLILFVRSILPVHALAAAVQSVSVVEREVERKASMKVGNIVLPAVVFHGTFDLCIIVFATMSEFMGESIQLVLITLLAALVTMALGLFWYIRTSKNQLIRLLHIEQKEIWDDGIV